MVGKEGQLEQSNHISASMLYTTERSCHAIYAKVTLVDDDLDFVEAKWTSQCRANLKPFIGLAVKKVITAFNGSIELI